ASSAEGTPISLTSTVTDPSSTDTAAGFTYSWSVTKNGNPFASGSAAAIGFTPDDNGSYVVTFTATDKDGASGSDSKTISATNVAPTATLSNNGPVNEASPVTVSFSSQLDPSAADTSAGFHYAYSCTNVSLAAATYAGSGASASTSCTFADNGSFTVRARIIDKDGGFSEYTTAVTVNNVAPTVTAPANQSANEGASTSFGLGSFSDVGVNDNPWAVDVDWGDGSLHTTFSLATQGAITAASHAYADNSTPPATGYTVTVKVTDKDGGTDSKTFKVTVANLAPTAAINGAPASSAEGTPISLTSTVTDPSSTDTAAGFTYSWSVTKNGNPFASGSAAAIGFTPDDNGSYVVTFTATDKDGASGSDSKTISATNVAPTATLANSGPVNEASPVTVSFSSQLDPSAADTSAGFHYAYSCTNVSLAAATYAGSGAGASTSCTFADNGSFTVRARIIDKDGGFSEYTTAVTVNNVAPTVTAPANQSANEGASTSFGLGSFSDVGVNDNPWAV